MQWIMVNLNRFFFPYLHVGSVGVVLRQFEKLMTFGVPTSCFIYSFSPVHMQRWGQHKPTAKEKVNGKETIGIWQHSAHYSNEETPSHVCSIEKLDYIYSLYVEKLVQVHSISRPRSITHLYSLYDQIRRHNLVWEARWIVPTFKVILEHLYMVTQCHCIYWLNILYSSRSYLHILKLGLLLCKWGLGRQRQLGVGPAQRPTKVKRIARQTTRDVKNTVLGLLLFKILLRNNVLSLSSLHQ